MRRLYTVLFFLMIAVMFMTSCGEPIIVEVTPSKPTLNSPIDSEQQTTVRLTWSSALRANAYDVYLGKSLGGMTLIAQNITTNYYDVTGLDSSSLYFWKVMAKNSAGVTPSDSKTFSTQALRTGNYIEIRDIATTTNSEFSITLYGNVSNVRAIEVILNFNSNTLKLAPDGTKDEIELLNSLSNAFSLVEFNQNSITVSISKNSNFSLSNEAFLRIACDTKAITGVSQITLTEGSRIIDANFNTVTFNKSDKGFVFIK